MRVLRRGEEGPEIQVLQCQLALLGYPTRPGPYYGPTVERGVREYQRSAGLAVDGIAGPITQAALVADVEARRVPELRDFCGRLGFLVQEEGHMGRPYWPGERDPALGRYSGITLDPGFDLGHQTEARLRALYGLLLTEAQLQGLGAAVGVRGEAARVFVGRFRGISISRAQAARVLPWIAVPFWRECARTVPQLLDPTAPAGAHTALLSLAFNAGADDLVVLRGLAALHDWPGVAVRLSRISTLPERRRREAALFA